MNEIFLVSVTHHTAPLALRERLALDHAEQTNLLDDVGALVDECAAIVTCNRTEIYGVSAGHDTPLRVRSLLAVHTDLGPDELDPYVHHMRGDAAARHVFQVAAGLDSLIIGEPQILGQVREAADFARQAGHMGPTLERLFNYAVVAGKRARHETSISRGAGSISHAAVELVRSTLGGLHDRQGLVVGLGEMGQLVARNLVSNGLTNLWLCNRSGERSAQFAAQMHASAMSWNRLDDALTTVDICITATSSKEPILSRAQLERIVSERNGRPLLLIDIAVPRNIEPSSGDIPGVHLHDIDSLQSIREGNLQSREQIIPLVEKIVDEELAAFREWHQGRASVPVIQRLQQRAESIRDHEVHRALRRLAHLDARDREIVMALSHAITNKMLHEPVTRLKGAPEMGDRAQAAIDLFGLQDLSPQPFQPNDHPQD